MTYNVFGGTLNLAQQLMKTDTVKWLLVKCAAVTSVGGAARRYDCLGFSFLKENFRR